MPFMEILCCRLASFLSICWNITIYVSGSLTLNFASMDLSYTGVRYSAVTQVFQKPKTSA